MSDIHLLVNPRAGGGANARRVRDARDALSIAGVVVIRETTGPGDEARLATEAHDAGARALVVIGGDGTVSHAARGLVQAGSRVPLAILAAGTANDFAKSIAAPLLDYAATARLLEAGAVRTIDVGTVDGIPFVNAAGFGFDADVVERLVRHGGRVGRVTYALFALRSLRGYGGFEARVALRDVPGASGERARRLMLVFANGQYFGGAFRIAPDASLTDGALDVMDIGEMGTARRLAVFARATRGAHVHCAEVSTARASAAELTFGAPPFFEADGELHRARAGTVLVGCLPGALTIVAP